MKFSELRLPIANDWQEWRKALTLWGRDAAHLISRAAPESGPTSDRPTSDLWAGRQYFDKTLGIPVYWNGTGWVDANGTGA